jgi:hypothetical protein
MRGHKLYSYSGTFPHFMGLEGSLPCLQETSTSQKHIVGKLTLPESHTSEITPDTASSSGRPNEKQRGGGKNGTNTIMVKAAITDPHPGQYFEVTAVHNDWAPWTKTFICQSARRSC